MVLEITTRRFAPSPMDSLFTPSISLMAADDGFASLLSGFVGRLAAWFSGWRDSWTEFVVKVFFALPTACLLYTSLNLTGRTRNKKSPPSLGSTFTCESGPLTSNTSLSQREYRSASSR